MLRASLASARGSFSLELSLEVERGATAVLVGESGAGKTTVLRLLAGLTRPDAGRIELDGSTWYDAASGAWVPAFERAVGYVAQDYALFPHLDVLDNVAFGLRAGGRGTAEARRHAEASLARLGIADLARRRPGQLSGGQQQRVALARALAPEPDLLLLDEPLSALDLQTRRAVRAELARLLRELPCVTVFVTHSPLEAMVFGDRIAVIENGRLVQSGSRDELLRRPRSAYVGELMGVNLFRGAIAAREADGIARVACEGGELVVVDPKQDGEVLMVLNPREVTLSREPPAGTAQNVLSGPIEEIVPEPPFGERVRVSVDSRPRIVAEVTSHAALSLGLRPGQRVYASFKATGVTAYR